MKKIYIDEDPNIEGRFFCPKCAENSKQNHVRYMFINLDEAVFKCEGVDCMFPYKNFKFKNYLNNTVYRYVKDCDPAEQCPNLSALESNMELLCATDTTLENIILETSNTSDFDLRAVDTSSVALDEDFLNDFLNEIEPRKEPSMSKIVSPPKILTKSIKLLESAKNAHIFKIPPLPGKAASPRKKKTSRKKSRKISTNKICESEVPKYEKVKPLRLVKEISLLKSNKNQTEEERAAKTEQIKRFMNFIDRSLKKERTNHPQGKDSPPKRTCAKLLEKPALRAEKTEPTVNTSPMKCLPDLF